MQFYDFVGFQKFDMKLTLIVKRKMIYYFNQIAMSTQNQNQQWNPQNEQQNQQRNPQNRPQNQRHPEEEEE